MVMILHRIIQTNLHSSFVYIQTSLLNFAIVKTFLECLKTTSHLLHALCVCSVVARPLGGDWGASLEVAFMPWIIIPSDAAG